MPVVCVLYDVPKNSKIPVFNDFKCCLTARQVEAIAIPRCVLGKRLHTIYQIQSQGSAKLICIPQCSKYEIQIKSSAGGSSIVEID